MLKFDKWSAAGYLALAAMCVVWVCTGWAIIFKGGFYSTPRRSTVALHVDGAGAVFMALLLLSMSAIATAIILKRFNAPPAASVASSVLLLGLPLAYLIVQAFG